MDGFDVVRWHKAIKHLDEVIKSYKDLIGKPGVNPYFALGGLMSYKERYNKGERSDSLLRSMEDCK